MTSEVFRNIDNKLPNVYDVLHKKVKLLINKIRLAGTYKIEYDGSNFASGVYFYRIEAGEFVQTKRMVLIK